MKIKKGITIFLTKDEAIDLHIDLESILINYVLAKNEQEIIEKLFYKLDKEIYGK